MAHYAELSSTSEVLRVIVLHNNEETIDGVMDEAKGIHFCIAHYGGTWIKTSYNNNIRGTYAGEGYSYNADEDIFITPQPYPSWTRTGSFWNAPIPMPSDGGMYGWDEDALAWVAIL